MKIPKVFPFYRGSADEFPEDEYRQWDWQDYGIRIYEHITGKSSSEVNPHKYKHIITGLSMWRKINSYRNRK